MYMAVVKLKVIMKHHHLFYKYTLCNKSQLKLPTNQNPKHKKGKILLISSSPFRIGFSIKVYENQQK